MTFTRLTIVGIILYLALAVLKVAVFKNFDVSGTVTRVSYCALTYVIAVAASRRLGVLNYLEAAFACGLWLVIFLFLDYLIVRSAAPDYFHSGLAWSGYIAMLVGIFFFHKKRHVQIRRELQAKHGHHH